MSRSLEMWGGFAAALVADDFANVSDVRRSWDQPRAVTLGLGWADRGWTASTVLGRHSGWPRTAITFNADGPLPFDIGVRNAQRRGNYSWRFRGPKSQSH